MQAIDDLKQLGFKIWLDGEDIHYEQKSESVDKDKVLALLAEIKTHKDEAIQYLQPAPSVSKSTDEPDADFIKANLIIQLHSDLIAENIYLCSIQELKDECKANDPDTMAYLSHEIRYLSNLKPEEIKKLHYAHKLFGGEFITKNKLKDSIFTIELMT